jgi:hypothetical protein
MGLPPDSIREIVPYIEDTDFAFIYLTFYTSAE